MLSGFITCLKKHSNNRSKGIKSIAWTLLGYLSKKLPMIYGGFPLCLSGKYYTCQCRSHRKHRFDPQVGKIPWRREMATSSSIFAWEISWIEEPGRLQSMAHKRVGHDLVAKLQQMIYGQQGIRYHSKMLHSQNLHIHLYIQPFLMEENMHLELHNEGWYLNLHLVNRDI